MVNRLRTLRSWISARSLATLAVLNIIGSSIALVLVDILYQPADARYYARRADMYVYVISAILIAIWSFYGLLVTTKSNRKGMKIYFHVLVFLMLISILIGVIHLILLYTLYRVNLLRSCVDDHMPAQFWWSLGFDRDDELGRTITQCGKSWAKLAIQRSVVWVTYSITLIFMAILVYRQHRHLENQWRLRVDSDNDSFDHETLTDKGVVTIDDDEKKQLQQQEQQEQQQQQQQEQEKMTAHNDAVLGDNPTEDEVGDIQHLRRQRLYNEIHHKRTHESHRQSRLQSQYSIHPLDPPPLANASQRPVEKMDYDLYREHMKQSDHTTSRRPFSEVGEDFSTGGATSRRRPTSWHVRNEESHHPMTMKAPTDEEKEEESHVSSPLNPQKQEKDDEDEDGNDEHDDDDSNDEYYKLTRE